MTEKHLGRPPDPDVDKAVKRVLDRLEKRPDSFTAMVKAKVITEKQAWSVRSRLLREGKIEKVGTKKKPGERGKPRVLFGIVGKTYQEPAEA